MDNVDKLIKYEKNGVIKELNNGENNIIKQLVTNENGELDEETFFKIKEYQSINEKNLMTLPFVWLGKNPPTEIKRAWTKSNGDTVSIRVTSPSGVPSIFEFDILLALLKIYMKDNGNGFYVNKNTKECEIKNEIHFTYYELSKEMGYKGFGGTTKRRLENGIQKLTETTMYSEFSIIDAKSKKGISEYKGVKSFRLIERYVGYEKKEYMKTHGEHLTANEIKDYQTVQLDSFFFENLKHSYFQVYNYNTYITLRQSISKRLLLIFSMWSKSSSKFFKYQTLYDYIGLESSTPKDRQSNNRMINKALKELVGVGFIDSFEPKRGEGVNVIFNSIKNNAKLLKDKYTTENECVARLREIGLEYEEIGRVMRLADVKYIAGLLRYMDAKLSKGDTISNLKQYFLKGIRTKFMIEQYI